MLTHPAFFFSAAFTFSYPAALDFFSASPLLKASNSVIVIAKPHRALKSKVISAIGVLICAWSAALLSFIFHGANSKAAVPVAFLAVVVLVSIRCGIASGVLGSAVAALVFATFLYAPLGTPQVANKNARSNIAWLILGGVTISYLLGSPTSGGQQRPN